MTSLRGVLVAALVASIGCSSSTQPGACGPSTCSGCCDAVGKCRVGSESLACGSAGFTCASCAVGAVCAAGACVNPSGGGAGGGVGGGTAGGSGGGTAGGTAGGSAGGTAGGSAGGAAGGSAGGTGGGSAGGVAGGAGGGAAVDCSLPVVIDWGTVVTSGTTTRDLVLTNPTTAPITATVSPLTSSSGDDVFFSMSGATGTFSIPASSSQTVTFTFQPTTSRAYHAVAHVRPDTTCPDTPIGLDAVAADTVIQWAPTMLRFGYVPPGVTLPMDVVFTNSSSTPAQLSGLTTTGAEFHLVSGTSLTIPANGTATATVSFQPAVLGPRNGTLRFTTNVSGQVVGVIALTGVGGGPAIDVSPRPLDLGQLAYFAGASPPSSAVATLLIRNTGTRPTPPDPVGNLHLGHVVGGLTDQAPTYTLAPANANTSAAEFTVTINPSYSPTIGVDTSSQTDLQIRLTPVSVGLKAATLTIFSNDLLTPQVVVNITADVVVVPACSLTVTPSLSFGLLSPGMVREQGVTVTNTGANLCIVSNVAIGTGSNAAFSLKEGPVASILLQAGESRRLVVTLAPTGSQPASVTSIAGTVTMNVSSPTAPVATSSLGASLGQTCLAIVPGALDFGTVARTCSTANRTFAVYDTCSGPLTLTSATMTRTAGEPAGGPNCAGAVACPEFQLVSGIPPNTVLSGEGSRQTFTLKYHAINLGLDDGAFQVNVMQFGVPVTYVLPLVGAGAMTGANVDAVVFPAHPQADVLLVVDDTGSMPDKQQSLAANFAAFTAYPTAAAVDFHLAVTTTDMSLEAGRIVGTPKILQPTTPNLALQFGTQVTVGTSGSATEESLRPALAALTAPLITVDNLGLVRRSADSLAVVVFSDADDQSPAPVTYYTDRLRNLKPPGAFTFSAMAPLLSSAPVGCSYDGPGGAPRANAAVALLDGAIDEICTNVWSTALTRIGKTAFGYRTRYPLNAIPDLTGGNSVVVTVNGAVLTPLDPRGTLVWSFDTLGNSVNFEPLYLPSPGDRVTFTYSVACLP